MTLTNTSNRVAYQGNGTTVAYPVPFKFLAAADLTLYFNQAACTTGFTVTGAGAEAGGTLTFTSPPPDDTDLIIVRTVPLTQPVDLAEHDPLPAETVEESGFDRIVMQIQQLNDQLARTVQLDVFSCSSGLTLPEPVAGCLLAWNATGTGLINVVNVTELTEGPTGPQGVPGAGASPTVTDCSTSVTTPTSIWFDADQFDVTEPGTGVAKVMSLTPPTGSIIAYGAAGEPTGWKTCNGQALSRTTFAALFAVLSTTWGAGDGATTFNVPDLRGRSPMGSGTGGIGGYPLTARTLAAYAGCETHVLLTTEMPAHSHTIQTRTLAASGANVTHSSVLPTGTANTSTVGCDVAHNITHPIMVVHFIIKV